MCRAGAQPLSWLTPLSRRAAWPVGKHMCWWLRLHPSALQKAEGCTKSPASQWQVNSNSLCSQIGNWPRLGVLCGMQQIERNRGKQTYKTETIWRLSSINWTGLSYSDIFKSLSAMGLMSKETDIFMFWDKASCSQGWPWAHYASDDELKLLALVLTIQAYATTALFVSVTKGTGTNADHESEASRAGDALCATFFFC